MKIEPDILICILAFPFVISFLFSLKLLKRISTTTLLKSFVIYTSVALLTYILFILMVMKIISRSDFIKINICGVLFNFSYLTFFIFSLIKNKYFKKLIVLIYIISAFLTINAIVEQFSTRQILTPNYYIFSLIFFCLLYYFEIFNSIDDDEILQNACFWIVTGVFVGMGTSLPYQSLASLIFKVIPKNQAYLISSIGTIFYSVMHLIFIKGFRCSLKIKNI